MGFKTRNGVVSTFRNWRYVARWTLDKASASNTRMKEHLNGTY